MSTPDRETIEEQIQECLKTVQKALGIEKERDDLERRELKGNPEKDVAVAAISDTPDKRKISLLSVMTLKQGLLKIKVGNAHSVRN